MFYARIVFHLDKNDDFRNLSKGPITLFTRNGAVCTVTADKIGGKTSIVLKYGGFLTQEEANEEGTNLVRCIKIQMVSAEIPISISGQPGILDDTSSVTLQGVITEYGKQALRSGNFFGLKVPESKRIEDDYIGLKVFYVEHSLDEIQFIRQDVELQRSMDFSIEYHDFRNYSLAMDISLSLLSTSISINDVRLKLLLRIMAVEALAPKSAPRDEKYQFALNQLLQALKGLEIEDEYKKQLKNQLSNFRETSILQRIRTMLASYLADKQYAGMSAEKYFSKCYEARSGFVHHGSLGTIDVNEACHVLKRSFLI